ncbi:MAG TPA: transglutaminase family protein [Aeromicrobium sp.]|nr:transglutaminase family protein [Aeromicrobium sp.]
MTMRYRVTHRTTYSYDADVTDSFGIAYLAPRELPWQQIVEHGIAIRPEPSDRSVDVDYYGNDVTYFQVTEPHRVLEVEGQTTVDVDVPDYDEAGLAAPWEQARPADRPDVEGAWRAVDLTMASPLVVNHRGAADYVAASLIPGRPVGEAVTDLMHRVHTDFAYDKTATTVTSTIDDVMRERAGVCQDFAHLMLSGLRSHGLAVRYVSGYLATTPPPGKERVVGADATHAWIAVWLPNEEGPEQWLAIDPTNDQWVNDRYVTVAWGRDYGDVPPVKGVIFTEATSSELHVSVDVAPLGS